MNANFLEGNKNLAWLQVLSESLLLKNSVVLWFWGKSSTVHLWLRTERFSLSISPCVSVYWQLRWEAGRGNGLICFLWLGNGKSPLRGSQLTDSNPSAQTSMRILLVSSSTPPPNVVSPMRPKSCKGITEKNQSLAVRPSSVLEWIV